MINTNITKAREDIFKLADGCIKYNDVVNITTKEGNVVMISEEEYNSLMETLYLTSIPKMKESLLEGAATPTSELKDLNIDEL